MSDPVYQSTPLSYFLCDRDPTASEPIVDAVADSLEGIPLARADQKLTWWNTTTNTFWQCTDLTVDALVWQKCLVEGDINIGSVNQPRAYNTVSSPAFNSDRTPNATKDVYVNAVVTINSTILVPASVDFQIDTGSGYASQARCALSGLAATSTYTLSALVPANASYKLVSSGGASIGSINELSN